MKNIFLISITSFIMNITIAQGNVGIGTTTPTAKLDVIGAIKITDGTQGLNKVLTSDANGRASWQDLSEIPTSGPEVKYPVVYIGCNAWMTENLAVSMYRNGDPIPLVTNAGAWAALTTGAYCYYLYVVGNDTIYGKLYNWYAVNDSRGLAPEGWHIPSDFEWTTLISHLGGNENAGGAMKAIGTTDWNVPNLGATNIANFNALPGGYRNSAGSFFGEGNFANWWTSSRSEASIAWYRSLNHNGTEVLGAGSPLNFGYSVRCIKD